MHARRLLFIAFLLMGAAGVARATTLARMSIAELTAAAQIVARVRCVANATRWENGEIWTITTFDVVEVWKGQSQSQVTVRLIGGRAGHLVSSVTGVPRFVPGEEVVLFLESKDRGEFSVTSWAQGTFRIARDRVSDHEVATQDIATSPSFNPATRRYTGSGIRRLPLEELREQVVSAEHENRSK